MNQLDHIIIAAPGLDAAKTDFEARTGTAPVDGGQHVGLGTRNALVSFGANQYLEIIAPDPAQALAGTFGGVLARMPEAQLLHFAIRVSGLAAVAERAQANGFEPGEIRRTTREQPTGERLVWELMRIGGHDLGGFMPFYIDWLECPHPSGTSPVVGALTDFTLRLPEGSAATTFLDAPDAITLATGTQSVTATFESSNGAVTYASGDLSGFRM